MDKNAKIVETGATRIARASYWANKILGNAQGGRPGYIRSLITDTRLFKECVISRDRYL